MPRQCSAFGCVNGPRAQCKEKGISLFSFPLKQPAQKKAWVSRIGRKNFVPNEHSLLCSEHFIESDFCYQPFTNRRQLKPGAIPSVFPHKPKPKERKWCNYSFQNEQPSPDASEPVLTENHDIPTLISEVDKLKKKFCEKETEFDNYKHAKESEISYMKSKLNDRSFSFTNLDESYFPTLIGFSKDRFLKVFSFFKLDEALISNSLSLFKAVDQFLLTLLRLRQGVSEFFLSVLFTVSQKTVNRIFNKVLIVLFIKARSVSIWPDKDQVKQFMPPSFHKHYADCRVIIDATEFFIQKPSNPRDQQASFSSYKHHNTVKSIIGMSPGGSITFISDLWMGSISDKELLLNSNLLEKLEWGDVVLADRGFTVVQPQFAEAGCKIVTPHFLSNKVQFSLDERSENKTVSSHRCNVERAINRLKSYKILDGVIPSSIKNLQKIHYVCTFLCNFSEHPLMPLIKSSKSL